MVYRYTVGHLRAVYGVFFGFVALVEIPSVFDPGKGGMFGRVFAAALVAGGSVLAVRGLRAATVLADDSAVTYRSLIRTKSWPWPSIRDFDAVDTTVGMMAYRRRVLYLTSTNGQVHKLEEINASAKRSPNPVDEVCERLNQLAEER